MHVSLTLPALERLIGGETEIEVHLRQQIVEKFAERHLKSIVNREAWKAAYTQWQIGGIMRKDLEGRLPVVYNGRSAAEWYTLYTQLALTTARERTKRAELVDWLRKNAMFVCPRCAGTQGDFTGRQVDDLRIHNGTQLCQYCYIMTVWPDATGTPPEWKELPVFDPFAGLL